MNWFLVILLRWPIFKISLRTFMFNIFGMFQSAAIIIAETQIVPSLANGNLFKMAPELFSHGPSSLIASLLSGMTKRYRLILNISCPDLESTVISPQSCLVFFKWEMAHQDHKMRAKNTVSRTFQWTELGNIHIYLKIKHLKLYWYFQFKFETIKTFL